MIDIVFRRHPARWIIVLMLLVASLLAACQTATANPATATARSQRVIAQATDIARQLRQSALLDEQQATATAQAQVNRLALGAAWPVILSDTFDDNTNEWVVGPQTGDYADASFSIAQGVFHWEATSHKGFVWWNHPTISRVDDFYLAVDYQSLSGPSGAYVGLVMRLDENGNYYLFSLRNDGYYSFDLYDNAQWISIIPWSSSPAIQMSGNNQAAVIAEGERFSFFVNGEWLGDTIDGTLSSGYSGLMMGMDETDESAAWDFDNFDLRGVLPPEATATP
jgi:hypothetical protein